MSITANNYERATEDIRGSFTPIMVATTEYRSSFTPRIFKVSMKNSFDGIRVRKRPKDVLES